LRRTERVHQAFRHASPLPGVEAFTFESDRSFPRHAHDQYGVGIVLSGAQRSWSGVGGVEAAAGDVIAVNPGEMHDGSPIGGTRRWRMIYFEPAVLADFCAEEGQGGLEFESPSLRAPERTRAVAWLFQALTGGAGALEFEQALLEAILPLFASLRRETARPASVARAIQRMREEISAPLRLRDLAAGAGLSRYQFLRAFSKATGATPHAYLLQLRAREARRRIVGGASLAEAALGAGFADQSHMTRAFVRQFGFTPGRLAAASR
jgi:AraC-like DNA-binding protein